MGIGLLILLFHRQIADYVLEQERLLVIRIPAARGAVACRPDH